MADSSPLQANKIEQAIPYSSLRIARFISKCAAHGEERVFVDSAGQSTQICTFNLYGSLLEILGLHEFK